MNEQALIDELKQPQYAGLSDQQAADTVNAKTVTIRQPVAADRVQAAAIASGLWAIVKIAAQNTALPNPPRGAAMSFVDWIEAGRPIDMDGGTVQGVGAVLLSYNLATQPQLDALQALADTAARWVDTVDIGEVGIGYVINARKAIAGGA
jgi:hypothetical protein